ncbi:hypothetical protein [Tropicimonas marinistellae]|uniref:hypothetical protein n=1 Tax=Tropicimonas marinistellae TaxID=1739787 RepID=UPI00082D8ABD|nr:hypothetical protein [Tropicimonas marinistellae]
MEANVEHHSQADDLSARLKAFGWVTFCHLGALVSPLPRDMPSCSDKTLNGQFPPDRLAYAERAAKHDQLNRLLDAEFPNAGSPRVATYKDERYRKRFSPATMSQTGRTVKKWLSWWEELSCEKGNPVANRRGTAIGAVSEFRALGLGDFHAWGNVARIDRRHWHLCRRA